MAEEKQTKKVEKKVEHSVEKKVEETKTQPVAKVEVKKVETPKVAKDVAVANIFSAKISAKDSFAICKVIRGKSIEHAIQFLEDVLKLKRAVVMASSEVPHQHGKGIAGARYPRNASLAFIPLLKQLKANTVVAEIENPIITLAVANKGSRPFRRAGQKAKRTHVHLEARDRTKLIKKDKK